MLAVFNVVLNYRNQDVFGGGVPTRAAVDQMMRETYEFPENEESNPIPHSAFTYESLKKTLTWTLPSTVKGEGLEMRHRTPLLDAVFKFISKRYGYWTDDVPHDKFFAE